MKQHYVATLRQLSHLLLFVLVFQTPSWAQYPAATDPTFISKSSIYPCVEECQMVISTALQSDGKILIGGTFWLYDNISRQRIARLNSDGELDLSFVVGAGANDSVLIVATQPDGKIIIGGSFTQYDGATSNRIARLDQNGALDNSFAIGTGANASIYNVAIQADGKIIIVGDFTSFNGIVSNHIARLNADGTLDNSFDVGTGADRLILDVAIQSDARIVIGGQFTNYNGMTSNFVARLHADGSLDNSFDAGTDFFAFPCSLCIQPDGKIIVGGYVSNGLTPFNNLGRLNSDGSIDATFGPTVVSGPVYDIVMQPDGKILIAGTEGYNDNLTNRIIRLLPDGVLDTSFDLGAIGGQDDGHIFCISLQPDGKIIIGGVMDMRQTILVDKFILRLQGDQVVTALEDKHSTPLVKLYPNPSTGILYIETTDATIPMELRISSILGVVQKTKILAAAAMQEMSLEGLPQGMYVYELLYEGVRKAEGLLQIQ